jgi:O-antigen ligase
MIFASGSLRFLQAPDKYLILVFVISVLVWLVFTDKRLNQGFLLYTVIFSGFLFIISIYTEGSLSLFSVINTTLKLIVAYLVLSVVGRRFVDTYISLIVLLAMASLFGYFTDILNLFGGLLSMLPVVSKVGTGHDGILYIFKYQHHIDRNNSIFFEPGAYQIFLNAAIFMLFFAKTEISKERRWIYLMILLMALLTTFSTTGFLILSIIVLLVLVKSKMISIAGKLKLVGVLLATALVFSVQLQYVLFEKIENYLAAEELTDSRNLRSFDALVDMEIFKRHVFGVGYNEYTRLVSTIGLIREGQTSSNGITKTLAIYGLPFALFLFASYYFSIQKLLGIGLLSISAFLMLLMFFVGESYYVFSPFCLAIVSAAFVYSNQGIIGEDDGRTNTNVD